MWSGGSTRGHRLARGAILEWHVGPRSLRCDLTWPGTCKVREGWPSPEGREGERRRQQDPLGGGGGGKRGL